LEPYALALLQEGPWYVGLAPDRRDISGGGECPIALKGSALEIIEEPTLQRSMATLLWLGAHFAVTPSRLKARPLRAKGGPLSAAEQDRARNGSGCSELLR